MPNGDENEVIIPDSTNCIGFPDQPYKLQVGGAAKGLGTYGTFPDALEAALIVRSKAPNIFIRIWGDRDKKTYYQLAGEFTP